MILNTFRRFHSVRPGKKASLCKGVTLIELAFVIAIIAIILVAVLGLYRVVKGSQELTEVTSDVAAIRQAVSTWASGGPLTNSGDIPSLDSWDQLAGFLPGTLGRQARNAGTEMSLTNVNSWGSTYDFAIDADDFYKWTLTVTSVPTDVVDVLATRLRDGVAADVTAGGGGEQGQGLVVTRGTPGQNDSELTVTYRH